MSYIITSNKSGSRVTLHCTGNATITIPGSFGVSNIATFDETITGAYISQIQWACPPGQYIRISRGGFLVGVFDSSNFIDFAGSGMPLSKAADKDLIIEFFGGGSDKGFCNIELKKIFEELNLPDPEPDPPSQIFSAGEQGYWLDPSDFSTMFQDSAGTTPVTATGQPVGRILDKSGRGNHFVQATAASRPILQTDGTNYFLLFDGTDDWLQSVATINPGAVDKAQVFAGVRKLSDAVSGIVVEVSVNRTTNDGTLGVTAPLSDGYGFGLRGTQHTNVIGTSFPAPVTNVLSAQYDIAQSTAATEVVPLVNGATPTITVIGAADAGTGNFLTYTHYIGRRAGSSFPFNGRVYQMIMRYGPNLTAGQIAAVEAFVNFKTGAY